LATIIKGKSKLVTIVKEEKRELLPNS